MRISAMLIGTLLLSILALMGLKKNEPIAVAGRLQEPAPTLAKFEPQVVATSTAPIVEHPKPVVAEQKPERTRGVITDPAMLASLRESKRQQELDWLAASPAKDTPEAKAIEELLAKWGVGREAVGPAYRIAWNFHHILRGTKNADMAMSAIHPERARLSRNSGEQLNEEFWWELVKIQPQVPFGERY